MSSTQLPAAGLLEGKNILITGVLTDDSLAFGIAREAQAQGANVILTGFGRGKRLTVRTAGRLDPTPDVLELDVTDVEQVRSLIDELSGSVGELHGILHAVGFAPESCLGDDFFAARWDDVATAVHVSTYSLRTMADIGRALMPVGGSIVGLTFDATVAWPAYNWMGVAKAGLESLNRYLARELGAYNIRCNLVAAGPLRTMAAKSIPGFSAFEEEWIKRAPLGWDTGDSSGVAKTAMALFTDLFSHTTGSIIHVDGGYHAIGA